MPQKYTVPQFIDVEDKIMGPLTVRQFLILMVASGFIFIAYKMYDFTLFVLVALIEISLAGILAFTKINGQPFHFFILNIIQTLKKPQLRVWDKNLSTSELKDIIKAPPEVIKIEKRLKVRAKTSKLSELTLIVNTGGVYNPEE